MIYKIDFLNIMMINIGKIILVLLLFVGCQIGSEYKGRVETIAIPSVTSPSGEVRSIDQKVYHFEYNNHCYIKFGNFKDQSIVHDPDCKCKQDELLQ